VTAKEVTEKTAVEQQEQLYLDTAFTYRLSTTLQLYPIR
jgi:hypothetical protein